MKRLLSLSVLALALVTARASELTWLTDLSKAQAQAKRENKTVLIDFTGSDWCGYCIKLHKDVFDTREFADYAKKNLVLVEVDFPHQKKLPAQQEKANQALAKTYKVNGYPTLVFLDSSGRKVGEEVGYDGSGVKAFLAKVQKYRKSSS